MVLETYPELRAYVRANNGEIGFDVGSGFYSQRDARAKAIIDFGRYRKCYICERTLCVIRTPVVLDGILESLVEQTHAHPACQTK